MVVNNLFDSLYLDISSEKEFVDGFKKSRETKSFVTAVPAKIKIIASIPWGPQLTILAGADYYFNSGYMPMVFAGADLMFSKRVLAGVSFRYGGYGMLNAGLHAGFDIGHSFIFEAGTAFADGYLSPKNATSQGAYGLLKKVF